MFVGGYSDDDSGDEYYFDDCYTSFDKIKKTVPVPTSPAANPRLKEETLETALLEGDLHTVEELLSNGNELNLDTILLGKRTPLMNAASTSQSHIVKYLLENGADPNYHCDNETPLMCACSSSSIHAISTLDCVKSLLNKNATVNIGDRYGVTPLMKAVQSGRIDVVNILLPTANIEMKDRLGKTAAFYAVESNNADILRVLAEKGAQLKESDRNGNTLKAKALSHNHPGVLAVLDDYLIDDDDFEQCDSSSVCTGESWHDMFPGILSKKPAFYFEIPTLLCGMNCERLVHLFLEKEVDLETFLSLNEQNLVRLGVNLPYERKKILLGLYKFHMHKWKMETVLGLAAKKRDQFNPMECLTDLGSHLRIVTVLKSSIEYNMDRLRSKNIEAIKSPVITKLFTELYSTIIDTRKELRLIKNNINKINKKNLPPADLIRPNNPLSSKSFKKTKIIFCLASTMVCIVFISVKRL